MPLLTTNATSAWLPEHVDRLVVQPALDQSIAAQVATVVRTGERNNAFYVPIVTADPVAEWTAEGAPITPSAPTVDQTGGVYKKLAALTKASNEVVGDADPAVLGITGAGMARDIARQLDAAFFGDEGDAVTPDGIATTAAQPVDADGYTNLDPFAEAISLAEGVGATITAWVAAPTTALALAQLKDADASNRPLLGADPTMPGRRQIFGIGVYVSPAVAEGECWGIPRDRVFVALRKDAEVTVDRSRYFDDDSTAIRAITRTAFAFAHEAAVIRITEGS